MISKENLLEEFGIQKNLQADAELHDKKGAAILAQSRINYIPYLYSKYFENEDINKEIEIKKE